MPQRLTGGCAPYYPPSVSEPNGASTRWSTHCHSPLRERAFHIDMMCYFHLYSISQNESWLALKRYRSESHFVPRPRISWIPSTELFLLAPRTPVHTTITVLTLYCNCLVIVSIPSVDSKLLKDRHPALSLYPVPTTVCGTCTLSVKELEWRIQRPLFF